MKNPIKLLLDEHKLIQNALAFGKEIQKVEEGATYFNLARDFIIFIRNLTEIYHYPKEEHILYPLIRARADRSEEGLIYEICDDHQDLRTLIIELESHYLNYDYKQLHMAMTKYLYELSEHINLENESILKMDSKYFTDAELENLYGKFLEFDEKQGGKEDLIKEFYKMSVQVH
jgi:hemerythrin-like domain-containing protein